VNKIYRVFFIIVIVSIFGLLYILYQDYSFKNNPLPNDTLLKIEKKKRELEKLVYKNYHIKKDIPIVLSSKLKDKLYGLAMYNSGDIKIVLNKNRFQESTDYMIDYVLPHEYAHTVMFLLNDFTKENSGHSKRWQQICLSLKGKKCDRFVNHQDIIFQKLDI